MSQIVIFLRSIEKKKKNLSQYTQRKKIKSKKTAHTVLSAEQTVLSEYDHCVNIDELCVQIMKYVLCVHCTTKNLL